MASLHSKVSVALPVFNAEKTISCSIMSIVKQSYWNWELLIVDDGSTDKSVEVARSILDPRVRVFADGIHRGLQGTLNLAVKESKGEYIARMDADDIAYPQRFEKQVAYLKQHPEIDLLGTSIIVFRNDGEAYGLRLARSSHEQICAEPWHGFSLPHPTWMGRAGWFRKNPYRIDAQRMEDQELLFRTYSTSRFACLQDVLLGYREDRPELKKILPARFNFVKLLFRDYKVRRRLGFACMGILGQSALALGDVAAVGSGLNYAILRHRAPRLPDAERCRWTEVWESLQPCNAETVDARLVSK